MTLEYTRIARWIKYMKQIKLSTIELEIVKQKNTIQEIIKNNYRYGDKILVELIALYVCSEKQRLLQEVMPEAKEEIRLTPEEKLLAAIKGEKVQNMAYANGYNDCRVDVYNASRKHYENKKNIAIKTFKSLTQK